MAGVGGRSKEETWIHYCWAMTWKEAAVIPARIPGLDANEKIDRTIEEKVNTREYQVLCE